MSDYEFQLSRMCEECFQFDSIRPNTDTIPDTPDFSCTVATNAFSGP